jgi:hypothetical protein
MTMTGVVETEQCPQWCVEPGDQHRIHGGRSGVNGPLWVEAHQSAGEPAYVCVTAFMSEDLLTVDEARTLVAALNSTIEALESEGCVA